MSMDLAIADGGKGPQSLYQVPGTYVLTVGTVGARHDHRFDFGHVIFCQPRFIYVRPALFPSSLCPATYPINQSSSLTRQSSILDISGSFQPSYHQSSTPDPRYNSGPSILPVAPYSGGVLR